MVETSLFVGFVFVLWIVCISVLSIAFYFIPTVIAKVRNHNNIMAIVALNILGGWTLFGWTAAIVWALTDNVSPKKERNGSGFI